MTNHLVEPAHLFALQPQGALLDVRSPAEFRQGHIPGARSFPLFDDAERAQVGTIYKERGPEAALLLGLEFVGPKLAAFVRQAAELAPERRLAVHCWRGGQRSQSMAWLLRTAGFDVVTLRGGYKNYRHSVLDSFQDRTFRFLVLGGRTGSGKTRVLRALRDAGEQIIDLEALANHKGSAFGTIGEAPQPTVEQFENDLHRALRMLDPARRVWVENESRSIGRVYIPAGLWAQLKTSPLFNIEIPAQDRIENLLKDYVGIDKAELASSFLKIDKKLGGLQLKTALEALEREDYETAAHIALTYYDKAYQHGLETSQAPRIHQLTFEHSDPATIARQLIVYTA